MRRNSKHDKGKKRERNTPRSGQTAHMITLTTGYLRVLHHFRGLYHYRLLWQHTATSVQGEHLRLFLSFFLSLCFLMSSEFYLRVGKRAKGKLRNKPNYKLNKSTKRLFALLYFAIICSIFIICFPQCHFIDFL